MSNLNNPAGRLRYWLDRADEEHSKQSGALESWAEVFEVDASTTRGRLEVITAGAALMDLAAKVRERMGELPPEFHADALMADFDEVETTLANFISVNRMKMEGFFSPLHATGWRSLEYADLHLSTQRPERWIDDSGRDRLLGQIRAVVDAVIVDDELTPDAKQFVIQRLREVEDAIVQARLRGVEPVEAANDSLIAGILRRADLGIAWLKSDTGRVVAGLVVVIAGALGMKADYLVLPGLNDAPAIEAPADPSVEVNIDVTTVDDNDPVDAEVVEDADDDPKEAAE